MKTDTKTKTAQGKPELPIQALNERCFPEAAPEAPKDEWYGHFDKNGKRTRWTPKPQHSPLPWQIINGAIFDANAHIVYASEEPNAKLIVASVNHAEALAEALRGLMVAGRKQRYDFGYASGNAAQALRNWEKANK